MNNNVINSLKEGNIDSIINLIGFLKKRASNKKSNLCYSDELFRYLIEVEGCNFDSPYCFIGNKHALSCYFGNLINQHIAEGDFEKQMNLYDDLLFLLEGLYPSKNRMLKKTVAEKLLMLSSDFGFNEDLLFDSLDRRLKIYFIPYESRNHNGAFLCPSNSIAMYRVKPEDGTSPEYVFLHELGHVLQLRLTNDTTKVPNSFIEFSKKYSPNYKGDLVEPFADLFTVAVMFDTPYEVYNPQCKVILKKMQPIIKQYFSDLCQHELNQLPNSLW